MARDDLSQFVGQDVVVDTDGPIIYIGTLERVSEEALVFSEVDVHYIHDGLSSGTKEVYVMESKKFGVRSNRKATWVRLARVMSISRLDDVVTF